MSQFELYKCHDGGFTTGLITEFITERIICN